MTDNQKQSQRSFISNLNQFKTDVRTDIHASIQEKQ